MLFCTINDFPAYGNLLGYSVKGKKACPICEKDTDSRQLKHGRKIVYLRYQRLKKAFNGHPETSGPPTPLTGVDVYEKVNNIEHTFGK